MILEIYHCNLLVVADKRGSRGSKGKSRSPSRHPAPGRTPDDVASFILVAGLSDVEVLPTATFPPKVDAPGGSVNGEDFARFLEEFRRIEIEDNPPEGGFVRFDWSVLADKMRLPLSTIERIRAAAKERGLLPALTIDYNLQKWLQHSLDKGVLVIMTCVESRDYDNTCLSSAVAKEIVKIRDAMINPRRGQFLKTAVIIPNVHLAQPGDVGQDNGVNVRIISECASALRGEGLAVTVASYGRAKSIWLGIVAHQAGGFIRRAVGQTRDQW